MKPIPLMLALAAACLGCGAPPPSSTEVAGSVSGIAFEAPSAVYMKRDARDAFDSARVFVLISDEPAACERLTPVGIGRSGVRGAAGQRVPSLWLEMPDRACLSGSEHELNRGLASDFDPATDAGMQARAIPASSGTARLDLADDFSTRGAQAAGSFEVAFEDGSFQGTFRARPCGQLQPGCSAAGGGLALFAALPLLLALRRRPLAPSLLSRARGAARRLQ
ncbi:MAG: hypothetical protein ACYC8T_02145 [Myxococcaceae bacterium]